MQCYGSLKVVSAILGRNVSNYINLIFPHDPLAARLPHNNQSPTRGGRCGVFLSSKNYHERSAKPHNTRPLSVIGWINVYFGLEWLVVPFVIVCYLGAQAAYRDTFF